MMDTDNPVSPPLIDVEFYERLRHRVHTPHARRVIDNVIAEGREKPTYFDMGYQDAKKHLQCFLHMVPNYRRGYLAGLTQVQDASVRSTLLATVPDRH